MLNEASGDWDEAVLSCALITPQCQRDYIFAARNPEFVAARKLLRRLSSSITNLHQNNASLMQASFTCIALFNCFDTHLSPL
jgi:hypothetical protein